MAEQAGRELRQRCGPQDASWGAGYYWQGDGGIDSQQWPSEHERERHAWGQCCGALGLEHLSLGRRTAASSLAIDFQLVSSWGRAQCVEGGALLARNASANPCLALVHAASACHVCTDCKSLDTDTCGTHRPVCVACAKLCPGVSTLLWHYKARDLCRCSCGLPLGDFPVLCQGVDRSRVGHHAVACQATEDMGPAAARTQRIANQSGQAVSCRGCLID